MIKQIILNFSEYLTMNSPTNYSWPPRDISWPVRILKQIQSKRMGTVFWHSSQLYSSSAVLFDSRLLRKRNITFGRYIYPTFRTNSCLQNKNFVFS